MSFPYMNPQHIVVGPIDITNVMANALETPVMKMGQAGEIRHAYVSTDTVITGNNANYVLVAVMNMTNVSATTVVGSRNCITNVNIAADTPTALTATEYTFAADDVLGINIAGAGGANSQNVSKVVFDIEYVYGSPAA